MRISDWSSDVCSSDLRAGLAAGVVAEHAHQLHGAIGYTGEFGLARLNRRLWQWREDFGGEAFWANEMGQGALAQPGPLWPQIVAGGPRWNRFFMNSRRSEDRRVGEECVRTGRSRGLSDL